MCTAIAQQTCDRSRERRWLTGTPKRSIAGCLLLYNAVSCLCGVTVVTQIQQPASSLLQVVPGGTSLTTDGHTYTNTQTPSVPSWAIRPWASQQTTCWTVNCPVSKNFTIQLCCNQYEISRSQKAFRWDGVRGRSGWSSLLKTVKARPKIFVAVGRTP